jgi:hypothetical protein
MRAVKVIADTELQYSELPFVIREHRMLHSSLSHCAHALQLGRSLP